MKKTFNKYLIIGIILFILFFLLCIFILTTDKSSVNGVEVGLSSINKKFLVSAYDESWDIVSDVSLYVSLMSIIGLAFYGIIQWISNKSPFKVEKDILICGIFIVLCFIFWIFFDKMSINTRPITVEGKIEASFPSTHVFITTFSLFSLCSIIASRNKKKSLNIPCFIVSSIYCFLAFLGRVLSGMHWMTDAIGGLLLGFALYFIQVGIFHLLKNKQIKE